MHRPSSRARVVPLLGGAQALSQFGDQLNRLALIGLLWAGATTPSTELIRFILVASLPALLLGIVAGSVADRMASRGVLIASDLARAMAVASMPVLYAWGGIVWVFVLFPFVLGFNRLFRIVRGRLLPEWLPNDALARANASLIGVDRSAEVVGAAIAGVLVAGFGWRAAFWMDAVTYVASAALLVGLPAVVARVPAVAGQTSRTGTWRATLRDARSRPVLSALVVSNAWLAGFAGLLVPRFLDGLPAAHAGGAAMLAGCLSASLAAGAVLAAFVVRRRTPTAASLLALLVLTLPVFALADPVRRGGVLVLVALGAGFLGAMLTAGVETALMSSVPRTILGRWLSLRDTGERALFVLGLGVAVSWRVGTESAWPLIVFTAGVLVIFVAVVVTWMREGSLGAHGLALFHRALVCLSSHAPVSSVLNAVARIAARTSRLHPGAARAVSANQAVLGCGATLPRVLASYGRYHGEVAALAAGRGTWFDSRTETEGLEHLTCRSNSGSGTIVVTAHIGNWDVLAWTLARHTERPAVFAERLESAALRETYARVRARCGCDTFTGVAGLRAAHRRLAEGGTVAFVADRSRDGAGIRVSFGTATVRLPVGPYRLARRTGAAVLPAVVFRTGTGDVCRVHPPLEDATEADMTSAFASILAGWVREFPEQWIQLSPLMTDEPPAVKRAERTHTLGAVVGR